MVSKKQKKVVNIGVVGAGFMSQVAHLANYAQLKDCRIVALAELRPKLRELVSKRYGIGQIYPSHKELLDDPDVEAIVVVTSRPLIGPIAFDCLNRGKHLLTEKPMAATVEQAELLVKTASEQKVCYAVGYMRRYDEGVQKAKQIIDELLSTGELGPITYVRAHCFMGDAYCNIDGNIVTNEKIPEGRPAWSIAPDWLPKSKKEDYAWFLNVYSHNINLLRFLLGSTPSLDYVRFDRKDGRVALLDFGEYEAVLEAGKFTYHSWDEVTEIYFAHGRLKIETPPPLLRNVPAKVELYKGNKTHQTYVPQLGWSWSFQRQAEHFIRCVQEDSQPLSSGTDALLDLRLIEEMWRMESRGR